MKKIPLVSIVIPTLNEKKNIRRCLKSIVKQNYPKKKFEIIIVDNYSTDGTLDIAKKFPVKILMNRIKHAEVSKMIGFRKARGEYTIYLDADVELVGRSWIQKMLKPLLEDEEIVGSFTRKYAKKTDPPLERYYAFDPLQRDTIYQLFSPSLDSVLKEEKDGYCLLEYREGKIPPAGRCLYRKKKLLEAVKNYDMFLELDFLVLLTKKGLNKFAYVPSAGLYHHHAPNLRTLLRKRKYNVQNVYLKTFEKKLYVWFDLKKKYDLVKIMLWIIYANSFIPSLIVGIYKSFRHKDWAGLYEPFVNLLVTDTILSAFLLNRKTQLLLKR
ncbi:hypothetical protein A2686_04510 [Candidatus Woesebacteria bacterium RIFCSPHIGHO2_01_FULL_38_10]|nr:MAG: hypothetical protein A2686_04510 [Candidatus Woesebacteria bacterium RIFCSPHIGHO2_01_FULL_38_10]